MHPLLRQQVSISLRLAMHALQAAVDEAERQGVRISIVVVDAAGRPIHTAHMDGAPLPSQEIALNKARTAVGFGLPTSAWTQRLERCSAAVRQGLPLQPGLALFGGGKPFRHAGQVIGAIGVSGASEELDRTCAQAAVERVETLLAATEPPLGGSSDRT
ncbi:GlcG/HbpS family heme-binding protein [Zestomonas thermotolerans]|uniref:GlcG/HbpS family heme-binding protein n=1 Tax=Zestomonas thermotolerans TaxID=157784 RepID=UPI00036C9829|nr:heme-binding protein [Pseudomonas thermotolerans]